MEKEREIHVKFEQAVELSAHIENVSISATDIEDYSGEYEIIPQKEPKTLKTENKRVLENIIVKGVPIYEVSNNCGGKTIYIGG